VRSIESPANPRIRALARLLDRRHRDLEGRFLVEGRREVEMAIAAGLDIETALVAPDLGAEPPPEVDAIRLSEAAFRKISVRQNPDGYAVVAARFGTGLARVEGSSLVLVAEGMEKPGNIGAMMRTADAAGAGILLASAVADVFNPNVVRASRGSLFSIPVAVAGAEDARSWLEQRVAIVVASPQASDPYWSVDMTPPTAIVVGAEHAGVSSVWDGLPAVTIPMVGAADSLNASVAAALLLFEAVRQRTTTP
jgi:TrmH family RNA methyltransferase